MRTYADDYGRGMNSGLNRDLSPEPSHEPDESQDVTLGMPALLGIFFAIVLVCAVFFGFGYSTGRIFHGKTAASEQAPTVTTRKAAANSLTAASPQFQEDAASATPPLASALPIAKPHPGTALDDEESAPKHASASAATSDADAGSERYSAPASSVRRVAASRASSSAVPAQASAASGPSSADTSSGGIMVQIAAVVHPADAQTLAQALRKNGYAAIVRTEPQDKFLHVQVGPFATRDEARAMQSRLIGNGYNAFIKQ